MATKSVDPDYLARGLSHFHAALRGRELNHSKVRDAVVRCALQRTGDFCAQDIALELVGQGMQAVHPVTVYRIMPLLLEAGLVRERPLTNTGTRRYEVVFERKRRSRLLCRHCGRSVELHPRSLTALKLKIEQLIGFELDVEASELHGRCNNCQV